MLLIFGTKFLWLGGTFFPSSWLHKHFIKISVYLFYVSFTEFNFCFLICVCEWFYMLL
jgi:hypothetical protein